MKKGLISISAAITAIASQQQTKSYGISVQDHVVGFCMYVCGVLLFKNSSCSSSAKKGLLRRGSPRITKLWGSLAVDEWAGCSYLALKITYHLPLI